MAVETEYILRCKNVSREIGGARVLDGIDLQLRSGESVAILGASGSGKSIFLRLINRLDEADGGVISFRGRDIREMPVPQLRRKIGMVFQQPSVLPGTVRDNLRVIEAFSDIRLDKQLCAEMLELVNLPEKLLERDASMLSGGEMQRLALARTLLNEPELLLLDEPTASLDRGNRLKVLESVKQVRDEKGLAILLVTHNPDDIKVLEAQQYTLADAELMKGL